LSPAHACLLAAQKPVLLRHRLGDIRPNSAGFRRLLPEFTRYPGFCPLEKLRNAVDLIVMPALGELQQFFKKGLKPRCSARQKHALRLNHRSLTTKADDLIALNLNRDRVKSIAA